MTQRARPDYGFDAPNALRNLVIGAAIGLTIWVVIRFGIGPSSGLSAGLAAVALVGTIYMLAGAAGFALSSRFGKLLVRDRILSPIPWRGDELVLDAGCGRGLLLVGAAKRLTTGTAYGIDLWHTRDQSGNGRDAALANVLIEGVGDRVEVRDGDVRKLPFSDGMFDVVVSSLVLHNIRGSEERRQALTEMARVLRPGGQIVLFDILHGGEYARVLQWLGLRDARPSLTYPLFLLPCTIVRATKPALQE